MKRTLTIKKKSQRERLRAFPLYRRAELMITVLTAVVAILTICLIVALVAKRATATPETTTQAQESVATTTVTPEEITTAPQTGGTVVSIRFVCTKTTETNPEVVETIEVIETEYTTEPLETEPQESAWDRAFREAKASVNMADARILALSIQGEAALARTTAEKAAVAWVILNAIECKEYGFGAIHSVSDVVKNPAAIQGYTTMKRRGVEPEAEYLELAIDVLARYAMERAGWEWVGRVIPSTYHWWMGDGYRINYFCDSYHYGSLATAKAHAWDWSWASPYED